MALHFHAARFTANAVQNHADHWSSRLSAEEREAFVVVQVALRRIADEDLATDEQAGVR